MFPAAVEQSFGLGPGLLGAQGAEHLTERSATMADTSRPTGSSQEKCDLPGSKTAQGTRPGGATATHGAGDLKNRGQEIKQNVQEGAQQAMHRAGEVASDLGQRAGEALSSAASTASSLASKAGERAEEAVSTVGERMHNLGSTVRERGPRSGLLGSATSAVASGLEAGGDYLQEEGLSGMYSDVQSLVRRYPVQALLVGVGIGYLMARATCRE